MKITQLNCGDWVSVTGSNLREKNKQDLVKKIKMMFGDDISIEETSKMEIDFLDKDVINKRKYM